MRKNAKTMVVIRRSGYYVNVIPNMPDVRRKWMANNLTRSDPDGKINKDGSRAERSLRTSMMECFVSFTPVTAADAANAPVYVSALARSYGLVGRK